MLDFFSVLDYYFAIKRAAQRCQLGALSMRFSDFTEVEKCLFVCMVANVKVGLLLKGEVKAKIVPSKMVGDLTPAQLAEIKRQAKVICIDMCMGADVLGWFRNMFGVSYKSFLAGDLGLERIEEEFEVAIAA